MVQVNKNKEGNGTEINKIGPKTEDESIKFTDKDNDGIPDQGVDKYSYSFGGFDDEFFDRQLFKESRFDPTATSEAGAMGIAQFMPETIQDMKDRGLVDKDFDPYNEEQSRKAQRDYMNWISERPYLAKGSDDVQAAKFLMAYNWGVGNAKDFLTDQRNKGVDIYDSTDWIKNIPKNKRSNRYETKEYVQKIMNINDNNESQDNFEEDLFKSLQKNKNPITFIGGGKTPVEELFNN